MRGRAGGEPCCVDMPPGRLLAEGRSTTTALVETLTTSLETGLEAPPPAGLPKKLTAAILAVPSSREVAGM